MCNFLKSITGLIVSDLTTRRTVSAKAAVYIGDADACWLVTETPSEVVNLAVNHPGELIELTLGNNSEWNGKPLYVRADAITAISPPRNQEDDDG